MVLRLNQTLNPSLLPPVHEACIDTYHTIARRFLEANLDKFDRFLLGMLPFFTKASVSIRLNILTTLKHLFLFEKEVREACSAIVLAVMPCFAENNKTQAEAIKALFERIEKLLGLKKFNETVWAAVLHSRECRFPALKFMLQRIPYCSDRDDSSD